MFTFLRIAQRTLSFSRIKLLHLLFLNFKVILVCVYEAITTIFFVYFNVLYKFTVIGHAFTSRNTYFCFNFLVELCDERTTYGFAIYSRRTTSIIMVE